MRGTIKVNLLKLNNHVYFYFSIIQNTFLEITGTVTWEQKYMYFQILVVDLVSLSTFKSLIWRSWRFKVSIFVIFVVVK